MKKFNKSTTIVLSVIICLFLVVGFILSFVPMTFGSRTYVSLFRTINISSDLMGGMYGEYDITTEDPSEKALKDSMKRIKEVFENDGYKNVNVYTITTIPSTRGYVVLLYVIVPLAIIVFCLVMYLVVLNKKVDNKE